MSLVQWEFHWMTGRKLVRWGSIPFRGWASSVGDSRWERRRGSRLELHSRRSCIRILFVARMLIFFFFHIVIAVCIVCSSRQREKKTYQSQTFFQDQSPPILFVSQQISKKNIIKYNQCIVTQAVCPWHTHKIEAEYQALVPSAFQLTECLIPFNMAWSILSKTSLVTP